MTRSALEQDLENRVALFGRFARSHDRAVVAGLLLCCVPIPPAPFVGLVLSIANLGLVGSGRLPPTERRAIIAACVLGIVTSTAAIALIIYGYQYATAMAETVWYYFGPHRNGPGIGLGLRAISAFALEL